MIRIFFGILFIISFHILIFVLYPDTPPSAHYWLYGLCGIWSFIYLYFVTSKFYNFFPFNILLKVIFFLIMIVSSLVIIPQEDKKSIIKKLYEFDLPTSEQIERGKIKFLNGLILKDLSKIKTIIPHIEERVKKVIKEINN